MPHLPPETRHSDLDNDHRVALARKLMFFLTRNLYLAQFSPVLSN